MLLDRPVKICLNREEVFYCHRGRHPVLMRFRTGVTNDGRITGLDLQTLLDGGAYGSYGVASTFYTGALQTVTYDIPALSVPRLPRVHQQAAVRPEARPRHAAVALRPGSATRQDRRAPEARSGRAAAGHGRAGRHADGELPARRDDRTRRVHPAGRRPIGLAGEVPQAAARPRPRPRVLVVSVRRRPADQLERPAALRRAAEAGSQRRRHGVLRRHRDRPGVGRRAGGDRGGGARHRSVRRARRHRRYRPHAGRSRVVLEPRHADDGQRRDPGGRARARHHRRPRSARSSRFRRIDWCSPTAACSTARIPIAA